MIKVIQVSQAMASGSVEPLEFDTFTTENVFGGDSNLARERGLDYFTLLDVEPNENPRLGTVWFIKGPDGKMTRYKQNLDMSE
jgi:hypothetical protein